MKPKLIIHGGTYKTGSTAIQNFFHLNRQAIYANTGILYPDTGLRRSNGVGVRHFWLSQELFWGRKNNIDNWAQLLRETKRSSSVFLSHENFVGSRVPIPEITKQICAHFDVYVIVYLRPFEDYFDSKYREWIRRQWFSGEAEDFVAQFLKSAKYFTNLQRWADLIGWDRIICKRYDRASLAAGDVVQDVCEQLEGITGQAVDTDSLVHPEAPNDSLNSYQILAMLMRNQLLESGGCKDIEGSRAKMALAIKRMGLSKQNAPGTGAGFLEEMVVQEGLQNTGFLLSDSIRQQINEQLDSERQAIEKQFAISLARNSNADSGYNDSFSSITLRNELTQRLVASLEK